MRSLDFSGLVTELAQSFKVVGASVFLVNDRQTIWSGSYGFADVGRRIPAGTDTVYKIGSITKLFTATAVMQLQEKNQLSIDEPVAEYLPGFSIKSRFTDTGTITLRTLMTHHSGLPTDKFSDYFTDSETAFRQIPEYLKSQYLCFPPGHIFSYSNLGTDLLGLVIEKQSGLPYWQYINEYILQPLGMDHSSACTANNLSGKSLAYTDPDSPGEVEPSLRDKPAGCIESTAVDMSHFIGMVLNQGDFGDKSILKPETLDQMFTVQNRDNPMDFGQKIGLSWMLGRHALDFAGPVCWHDGGSPHFFSLLVILPEQKMGLIILTNSSTGALFTHSLADLILARLLTDRGLTTPPAAHSAKTKNPLITGDYATLKGIISVKKSAGSRSLLMGGNEYGLSVNNDGWWNSEQLPGIRFSTRKIDGVPVLGMEQSAGQMVISSALGKIYSPVKIPLSWRQMSGSYLPQDRDSHSIRELHISGNENHLTASVQARKIGRLDLVIQPVSDTEGVVLGLGRFAGDTLFITGKDNLMLYGVSFVRQS